MELFPPLVAQVMLVLVGVIGIVSLVVGAYNSSILISGRRQFLKIEVLEQNIAKLQQEIKELKSKQLPVEESQPVAIVPPAPDPLESTGSDEVWADFLNDYNNLAASMDVPKAPQACETFAGTYQLSFLICIDHASQENGVVLPKFAEVKQLAESTYWAWPVPDTGGAYVVVPNPLHAYDEKLHTEGGMKETFASNYEAGSCKEIKVRLPAKFQNRNGNWKIIQPGVIKVK
ncbi:hypothetical protein [Selenomonas sp.]|uniref:hypothetical protein n=1 Tax=Selenomonas sp. TaxID=2053611 RepID=UPI0025DBFED1|nr:hypothetical protein [Selenomonas sp.]MBQ1868435.1 hypothetical protein [Selenomonas sp.]